MIVTESATQSAPSRLTTLIFEWGDTLMVNDPAQSGPMVRWPEVASVKGAAEALALLKGRYHLVVATNATDSRSREVRAALARVGLDHFFEAFFTSGELGSRKPDPAFYQSLQSVLGIEPSQAVMIGDDYRSDVLGAHTATWTTIWYNPSDRAAPGLLPIQDAEITRMEQLPALMGRRMVPGYNTCLSWLLEQNMPHNLLSHVHTVAAVAYQMAVWLESARVDVDPLLTHRGALLHDLAKLKAMELHTSHAELAARMLKDRGEPILAECARRHALFSILQPENAPRTWEEKLVYFADKLVEGSKLAGLDERIDSLRQRYPSDSDKIAAMGPALYHFQDTICAALGFRSTDLVKRLKSALRD